MKYNHSSCTTILVGKNASYDGSTMMARDEDSPPEVFNPKKYVIIKPNEQPKKYKIINSDIEILLPDNPYQYTEKPDAIEGSGIFGEAGINSVNIAMTATETITSNEMVLGADPLVENGIGEADFLTIVLPYIKSAKEGVIRLGELLEKYGTYESNGIGFQDENDIWWMETIGGHHFVAKRVPEDSYVVCPNQQGIQSFDFVDAFGEQKNNICSKDLIDFIKNNHLDLAFYPKKNDEKLENNKNFDFRAAFCSKTDFDKVYNTPRAWFMLRYFNKNSYKWDESNSDFSPESLDLPWCLVPEHKITIEDIKYVLSSYYQGTKYNPYSRYGDLSKKKKYRTIGYASNTQITISQIRSYLPDKIKAIEWMSFGPNPFNELFPQYSRVNDIHNYLKNTTDEVSTDNSYWINRLIGTLADQYYSETIPFVEKYQNLMSKKGHEFINKFDNKFKENKEDASFLENANHEIVEFVKKETNKLLGEVLYISSLNMKNAFSRSDA